MEVGQGQRKKKTNSLEIQNSLKIMASKIYVMAPLSKHTYYRSFPEFVHVYKEQFLQFYFSHF
jgi:hypothetical protein